MKVYGWIPVKDWLEMPLLFKEGLIECMKAEAEVEKKHMAQSGSAGKTRAI